MYAHTRTRTHRGEYGESVLSGLSVPRGTKLGSHGNAGGRLVAREHGSQQQARADARGQSDATTMPAMPEGVGAEGDQDNREQRRLAVSVCTVPIVWLSVPTSLGLIPRCGIAQHLTGFNKSMTHTTHTERDLTSTARVCELLQSTPRRIERAAEQAHVEASLRLNDVAYWSDDAIGLIREQLKPSETNA